MDKIIKDIEIKVRYYELFTKIKYAGMGSHYKNLKEFIQNKIKQYPDITLNNFEFELFQKISDIYIEMNDIPDMVGFEGQCECDY